ncbi:MAG TPA: MOSC domain-containing protein [Pyrinomonadaceae bacterium]|nr:MOSC domain-containing protein [Pyrinomonadaceae bacterium]
MKLSEINLYPIKSLKGIAVSEAAVEDRGLRFDRRWMLVDEKRQFITQRECPAMAAVMITLGDDHLRASVDGRSIDVPFDNGSNKTATVQIWSSSVKAKDYDEEINDWFSQTLGISCSLVSMPETTRREVNPLYAVRKFKDTVSFADGYPFMLIGEASLDDLNSRLETPIPMNRFRPNFVVAGTEAFAEDTWKKIRIGDMVFHVVKPCERCVIPTIDQASGIKTGKEPLATLSNYRNTNGKVLFGQNLIADRSGGVIKRGDTVEVIEVS